MRFRYKQRLQASAEAEARDYVVHLVAARTHVHPRIVLTVGVIERETVADADTAAA